jgi:hypothetical protein
VMRSGFTGVPRSWKTAPPLGPYGRTMPMALWQTLRGAHLLMSGVPL